MKDKIFNKLTLRYLVITIFAVFIGIFGVTFLVAANQNPTTEIANVQSVSQKILATGSVEAQNQANLNFQIGGKLVYLPFKEGDTVYQGQTIASLDTYSLQNELQQAANTYETAKNNAGQVSENQSAGVLEGQQRVALDTTNKTGYSAIPETSLIYDSVKIIVDNANLAQDSARINVNLSNYALQLATLISPINGIILHEDVTLPNVNITPLTSFVIADPNSAVFSANVRQQDIDFISVGKSAAVTLDANSNEVFNGTVDRIYPQKITLSNGDEVYRVDIKIDNLPNSAKIGQGGTALIRSNFNGKVILVPSWTVLSNSYIWVFSNGKPILKKVTTGATINGRTEVLSGLSDNDKVIVNPKSVIEKLYQML